MQQPKFILTDIEGTTTPKSFVYAVLFPFFTEHLEEAASIQGSNEADQAFTLIKDTMAEENDNAAPSLSEIIEQLRRWVETDRKHPGLKLLQGMIWEKGYQDGRLKGTVYDDVPKALALWKNQGIDLGVYSSGSVRAQQLLFGYSNFGDLTPYFSAYFDTRIGHKREGESYSAIANELGLSPSAILFLSDIKEELDAAAKAGMKTIQLVRDDSTEPATNHKQVTTFKEILWK
jgi:enolase-phosphatase E1